MRRGTNKGKFPSVNMATLHKALRLSGTKSASLLSSNLDWAVSLVDESGLVETEWVEVLKERNVTRFVKAQVLLYLVEREEDGYERLLTVFRQRLDSGTISGPDKALQAILAHTVNHDTSEGERDVSATAATSRASSITDAVPILPQAMFLNEHKVMALLQMAWVDLMPLMAEEELMDVVLRRKLIERNCTSHEKAKLIVDHAASISSGFEKLLRVFMRHAAVSRPCKELVRCITTSVDQLKDTHTATMVEMRIRSVFFPAASCWPGRIGMAEPLNEVVYQELYCRVWYMARNGKVSEALEQVEMHRNSHLDVYVSLVEAVLTVDIGSHNLEYYDKLEGMLAQCKSSECINTDLLQARIHKRLIGYYFYTRHDMATAASHLEQGYQLLSRIEPDDSTVHILTVWAAYMNMLGRSEEALKACNLAMEHVERLPRWMRPTAEGVKIDKAVFHIQQAQKLRDDGEEAVVTTELRNAVGTLDAIDSSLLPKKHTAYLYYAHSRIQLLQRNTAQALSLAQQAHELCVRFRDRDQLQQISSFLKILHAAAAQ